MQAATGNIYTEGQVRGMDSEMRRQMIPLADEDVPKLKRMSKPRRKGFMRNKPCVCGSGKKFKKCC